MFSTENISLHSTLTWFVLTMFTISFLLLVIQIVLCLIQKDRHKLPLHQRKSGYSILRQTSASQTLLLCMAFVLSLNFSIFLAISARPDTASASIKDDQTSESILSPASKVLFWPVLSTYSFAVGAASSTFDAPSRLGHADDLISLPMSDVSA
jgi:hypothetical protein